MLVLVVPTLVVLVLVALVLVVLFEARVRDQLSRAARRSSVATALARGCGDSPRPSSAPGMGAEQEVEVLMGPWQREPSTDGTRASIWSTRSLPRAWSRQAREGRSGGSLR